MASTDLELGNRISAMLVKAGIETPIYYLANSLPDYAAKFEIIRNSMANIMDALELDRRDDSLKETPERVAKMFVHEIFYGLNYSNFPKCTVIENKMGFDEVITMKNILVRSMCEHHFVPFVGVCHIGYIPKGNVIGLSKLNRIVDFFCRRPQVQERLTEQVAATLREVLETPDIAVVIDAEHFCIKLRGIQDPHSTTATSKMLGRFKEVPALRAEFFSLTTGR